MKQTKYIWGLCAALGLLAACEEEKELATTDVGPAMEIVTVAADADYGTSAAFSVKLEDRLPLSTLKVQLYFDGDMVSEEVIRTKENGLYEGGVAVPYYKNLPDDGEAELRFIAQNVRFGLTEAARTVALHYPRPDYLEYVLDDGRTLKMTTDDAFTVYSVTAEFSKNPRGYIRTAPLGSDGAVVTFGYGIEEETVVAGSTEPIPFSSDTEGEYPVTFNIRTFEGSPFDKPKEMTVNEVPFTQISAKLYQADLDLTQGAQIAFGGPDKFEPAWIDDNYFAPDADVYKFLPVSGRYRIMAEVEKRFIQCKRINADGTDAILAADGTGGLWLMGWGVGAPSQDYQFGFTPGTAYSLPEVSPKVYRLTGKAGPETGSGLGDYFRMDYISMKYFHQNGWGGEMARPALTAGTEALLKFSNEEQSANLELADGVRLTYGATYELTIDLSGGTGVGQAAVTFRQVGEGPAPVDGLLIDGEAMEVAGNGVYSLDLDLTAGQTIVFSGSDLFVPEWINPDFFEPVTAASLKLLPVAGKYRITADKNRKIVDAVVLAADGSAATLDDNGHGALYFAGYGIGSPSTINEPEWHPENGVCIPEQRPQVYTITAEAGPEDSEVLGQRFRVSGWSGKFYKSKAWGDLGAITLSPGTEAYLKLAPDGNLEIANNLEAGATYRLTIDLTGGNDHPVVTMEKK